MAGGCAEPASEAVPAMNEQQRLDARLQAETRARAEADPCLWRRIRFGHEEWAHFGYRNCLDLLPARVMRGVWFMGFEESGFIPDVDSVPLHRVIGGNSENPEFDIVLDIDEVEALRRMGRSGCRGTCAYAIKFIGRRSRHPGNYYSGEGNHVVVVDALLTGRLLGRVMTRIDMRGCEGECAEWR